MKPLALALAIPSFLAAAHALAAPTETQVQTVAAARAEYLSARRALQRDDFDEAIESLRRAERMDPQNADVQNMLGFAHREKGEVEESFRFYHRALELNPDHRGAHEYIGRAYLYFNKPEKAKEHLARLEDICMGKCPERDALRQAIAEWTPWRRGVRGARAY